MAYYNTTQLKASELNQAILKAKSQQDVVRLFFQRYPGSDFTAREVEKRLKMWGKRYLLTSIRRSMSDLKKDGELRECGYRYGDFGKEKTLTWNG